MRQESSVDNPNGHTGWEHFSHMADIGIRGYGKSLETAFEQAACALMAVICELNKVRATDRVVVKCNAAESSLLFVDWLNSLIYEMATRKMLFSLFKVEIDGPSLVATAWGEKIDSYRHRPAVEPKGATYTELKVERRKDGMWIAQCVIDV